MNVDWTSVLQSVGIFAVGSGVFGWLVKTLVAQGLSKDLEAYKAALSRETERFKAQLETKEFEQRTKFSKLYDRVEAALIDLYDKLFYAHRSLLKLGAPAYSVDSPARAERVAEARRCLEEATEAWQKHRLFLSSEVDTALRGALDAMVGPINLYDSAGDRWPHPAGTTSPTEMKDLAAKIVRVQLWPAMERVREELRRHLGVKSGEEPLAKDAEERA